MNSRISPGLPCPWEFLQIGAIGMKIKTMKKSYEDFILPVFVIHAAECAAQSGEWEEIPPIDLSEVV